MARITFDARPTVDVQIPLRSNTDPLDPRQVLLPAFVGFAPGGPLMLPQGAFEALSEHIIEYLGVPVETVGRGSARRRRLVTPLGDGMGWEPRRKYRPPVSVLSPRTAAGEWVTMDEPDPVYETVGETVTRLSSHTPNGIASYVLVCDFRRHLGLSHAQAVLLLAGWGIPNAKPGTRIEHDVAEKILRAYRRSGAPV